MKYFLFFLLGLIISCSSSSSNTEVEAQDLKPEAFLEKMNELDNEILLDVRTAEELINDGSIENAINFDFYGPSFKNQLSALDTLVPVMVYCRSGGRSGETAKLLKEMGFKSVYNLDGGITEWNKFKSTAK